MNFENRSDVSIEEYLEMIRLKTAVLIEGSMLPIANPMWNEGYVYKSHGVTIHTTHTVVL